ncbi:2-dehydro-3-deoxygalactonokinase [Palleronia aestuarii]|uniref:2-dehydro-3-deoxygalactonokinase n=1 Tax=Palleronia aestuarii TaxID=568105 RepID=A0A2W7PLF4_9RHOB|nr:2-dehydro-3-deoxygalactonokinase [Palleronia aestuarii]PZX10129.1 2-dehydro-3-deoxygalactonokinase [Palleronia aestuarii]
MSDEIHSAKITPAWIALDWGTSHLRGWAMSAERDVLAEAASDAGMGRIAQGDFEAALLDLVSGWELPSNVPVIACGMVGARQGWKEAPYRKVPCPPLAGPLTSVLTNDPRLGVAIVPGLSQDRPPDVMRGEETQIAGFLSLDPDFDGVICLPGSHTKWVRVSAGEIVSFQTAMTGELYAAISDHTVLRHSVTTEDWNDDAFRSAVSDAISRPESLSTRLFSIRAEGLSRSLDPGTARARLSGLLIGAELAATRAHWLGMQVALIGTKTICDAYDKALEAQGVRAMRTKGEAMSLAGLSEALKISGGDPS